MMDGCGIVKMIDGMDVVRHFTNEWSELWLAFVMKMHNEAEKEDYMHYARSGMCAIERNRNLTMDVMEKHIETIKWDFRNLSENPNLTFDFIQKYRHRKWNKSAIVRNGAFTIDELTQNKELRAKYYDLSYNPNLTIDHVLQKPNVKWSWYALAKHPNITIDMILSNPDLPWYSRCGECFDCKHGSFGNNVCGCALRGISKNQTLTIDFIRTHLRDKMRTQKIWFWIYMSKCKNIKIVDIVQNPDLPLSIDCNPNLSLSDASLFSNDAYGRKSHISRISANPCTTMKTITDNPYLPTKDGLLRVPWDYQRISKNPNLTMKFLRDHPNEKWDWYHVIQQPFDEDRNTFITYHAKWLLLLIIYDSYVVMDWNKKRKRIEIVEMVLANDYLVKKVMQY
jgi:hypothetical protein